MGQICVALSRILIPRSRYEEIVAGSLPNSPRTRSDPLDPTTVLGPLGNERALVRVESMLERSDGAKVVAGGRRPPEFNGEGSISSRHSCAMSTRTAHRPEVFGPIIVAIAYDDVEDAIAIAKLPVRAGGVGVLGRCGHRFRGRRALAGRKCGEINLAGVCLTEPFGIKQSGWGREGRHQGIRVHPDQAVAAQWREPVIANAENQRLPGRGDAVPVRPAAPRPACGGPLSW